MSQKQLLEIKALIDGAELSLQQAREMLAELVGEEDKSLTKKAQLQGGATQNEEGQIIEGVFDGQNMIGPDGKQYSVPANYASKSKLVEGDLLKLTIDGRGHFIYKQIGPIDRIRLKGTLTRDSKSEEWRVLAEGKAYKVLLASVTYFKGELGDQVVIMVPKDKSSTWAAVENIIKQIEGHEPAPMIESHPQDESFDQSSEYDNMQTSQESEYSESPVNPNPSVTFDQPVSPSQPLSSPESSPDSDVSDDSEFNNFDVSSPDSDEFDRI